MYWGYQVRFVDYFSALFKTCPYDEGYQIKILVDARYGEDFNRKKKKQMMKKIRKRDAT